MAADVLGRHFKTHDRVDWPRPAPPPRTAHWFVSSWMSPTPL